MSSSGHPTQVEPIDIEARMDFLPENLWTVSDVAKFLRASKSWVYKAAERGELPCIRLGAMLRFDPQAIRAMVRRASQQPSVPVAFRTSGD